MSYILRGIPMQSILIVEDDLRLATLLRSGVEEAGYSVLLAYDGEMALRLIQNGNVSLVVSDIILPGISGIELCKKIRSVKPETAILMLTALGTTDDKLEGFDAGADDYMTKPFDFRELLVRISVLLKRRGASVLPANDTANILQYGDLKLNLDKQECFRGESLIKLTPREFSLLRFLMENAERVVSRSEIQRKVWNIDFDTGTNFIDVYINYLRRKIDHDFNTKLIHTKPGFGFILSHEQ